ncbi:uncharacterized protein LOC125849743 [Solanum stenotomum]|uniref:uncharacterized protein LOC125849743 n=1 Tax=Solanum stenotomum TaxID=172797 RepID=UPI0020D1633B|nr:uncharacterized protein LOC125849743 [Solanum stenotomum]
MTGTSEETGIVDVTIRNAELADQSELISQLMQRIADMQEELQQTKDLAKLAIASNEPPLETRRPPPHFPSLSSPLPNYFPTHTTGPITSIPNPHPIDLTISSAPYANTFYQTPPPLLNPNEAPNTNHSQNFTPTHQIPPPVSNNPRVLPSQPVYPSVIFQTPPAYTIPEPCPGFPVQPELDHYEEMEKEWRLREEKREQEMNVMKDAISEAVKSVQSLKKITGLEYEDLCMHPDLEIPEGYKIRKFETFNGIGNPMAHLRAYCDKLVGIGKNDALIMRLFSRSLGGEALEWFTSQELRQWSTWGALAKDFLERFQFNVEAIPDRYYLEKIKQKTTEDYREYVCRWRKEAAKVQHVMTENEITSAFIRAQEPKYYERMLPMMGQKFSKLIRIREAIEDGLKSGKVTNLTALQAANKSSPSMATGFTRKKKEDMFAISFSPRPRPQRYFGSDSAIGNSDRFPTSNIYPPSPQAPIPIYYAQQNYQAPPPVYQNQPLTYQNTLPNHQANAPVYQNPGQNNPNANNLPRPNLERKPPRVFTPLAKTRTQLFERLRTAGLIQPVDARVINPTTKFFRANQRCAYHSRGAGHDTEGRINLKHKIQDLIDNRVITLQAPAPNVNLNPLSNHGGATINMIERDEDWLANGTIGEANVNSLIPTVASLTIKAHPEFVVITAPHQAFALVKERSNKHFEERFVVQAATAQ